MLLITIINNVFDILFFREVVQNVSGEVQLFSLCLSWLAIYQIHLNHSLIRKSLQGLIHAIQGPRLAEGKTLSSITGILKCHLHIIHVFIIA